MCLSGLPKLFYENTYIGLSVKKFVFRDGGDAVSRPSDVIRVRLVTDGLAREPRRTRTAFQEKKVQSFFNCQNSELSHHTKNNRAKI